MYFNVVKNFIPLDRFHNEKDNNYELQPLISVLSCNVADVSSLGMLSVVCSSTLDRQRCDLFRFMTEHKH